MKNYHIEDDRLCECFRATCANGYRWEEGLHEYVVCYSGGWKKEARAALKRDIETPPEVCDDPQCEWCEDDGQPRFLKSCTPEERARLTG